MSIEYDDKLRPVITIGDGDVLTGCTSALGLVRFWMAPRKDADGLVTNEVTLAPNGCPPPGDEAVTVYFVSKAAIDGFIDMLTRVRDKAFPVAVPSPELLDGPPKLLTPEQFKEGWRELTPDGIVQHQYKLSDVISRDGFGNFLVRTKKSSDSV